MPHWLLYLLNASAVLLVLLIIWAYGYWRHLCGYLDGFHAGWDAAHHPFYPRR